MSLLFLDFETKSEVDIRKAGADVYARHPSTDVLCMGWAFDESPVSMWTPKLPLPREIMLAMGDPTVTFVAHNAPFELSIWNYCMFWRYGVSPLTPERFVCTMAMAYAMAIPGSLDGASNALCLDHTKDMTGSRVMLQLAQPRKVKPNGEVTWWEEKDVPEKFQKLYSYCQKDVEVERALYKRLMRLSKTEREIWLLDQRINQRGVQIDLSAAKTALKVVEIEKERLDQEMKRVTRNAVSTCTASGQLTDWIRYRGVETEGVAKPHVLALLEKEIPEDVRQALQLRQEAAKSSTAKLSKMLEGTCDDGRMRGIFQYHGAATGRWAGRRVQPQNFPRPQIKPHEIDYVFDVLGGIK